MPPLVPPPSRIYSTKLRRTAPFPRCRRL